MIDKYFLFLDNASYKLVIYAAFNILKSKVKTECEKFNWQWILFRRPPLVPVLRPGPIIDIILIGLIKIGLGQFFADKHAKLVYHFSVEGDR